MEDSAEKG